MPLSGQRPALVPFEQLRAAIERLLHERARRMRARAVRPRRAVQRLAFRRIDPPNRDLIEAELLRRLRDDRLHDRVRLHRSRRPLLRPRRRVRNHREAAPAHRLRLPDERRGVAGGPVIAHRPVGAVVFDDEEIERGDSSVFGEADARAAGHPGARAADVMLFLAADAHHDRGAGLLRQQRRNDHRHSAGALAAESAAAVFADEHDSRRIEPEPRREGIHGSREALRRPVQEEAAVLPVRHRAARFHRLMARRLDDERLVDDDRGALEPGVEVAERPLLRRFARRQRAVRRVCEVGVRPFQGLDRRTRRRRSGAGRRAGRRWNPHVAFQPRIGPARPQTFDRIDDERQRFQIDRDALNRLRRDRLADGGHGEDRLALVQRFVGQRALRAAQIRKIVRCQNRLDARHRERGRSVNLPDPRMRHRTQKDLREQHPFGPVVLRVLRAAGDLGHQVGRRVVHTDEFLVHCSTGASPQTPARSARGAHDPARLPCAALPNCKGSGWSPTSVTSPGIRGDSAM